jgi:hypothetical protein
VTELPERESPGTGRNGRPSRRPTEDDVFDVLANRRRRYVLRVLAADPVGPVDIGDLAERVAAWENERPVEEVSPAERKRVYTALQQSHLPKMEDAGVLTYDKDAGTVDPTPALARFDAHLSTGTEGEAWHRRYLAVALVGGAGLVAAWLGVLPAPLSSEAVWAALVVVAVLVTALAHELPLRSDPDDGTGAGGERAGGGD